MPVPCPLCGTRCADTPLFTVRDRLHMTAQSYDVLRCPSCGTLALSPFPTARDIDGLYPEAYNFKIGDADRGCRRLMKVLEWRLLFRPVFRRNYRILRALIGRDGFSVLDIGCGSGLRMRVFREAGCVVEGNETSASCVAYIRAQGGMTVHHGRIETLAVGRRFDAVTMYALLEHLTDPAAVVAAAKELLAPDGVIAVQVPVVDSLQFRLLGRHSAMVHDMPRHVFIPSVRGLRRFMRVQGFELVALRPVSIRERASLFALGVMPGAATPRARIWARAAGWVVALLPGLVVALWESFTGVGAEVTALFRPTTEPLRDPVDGIDDAQRRSVRPPRAMKENQ